MQAMENNSAAERLAESQAVALAIATALNGKDHKVKRFTRLLAKTAYPEVEVVTANPEEDNGQTG